VARDGRAHELSRAGAGKWPGRKTARRRRRPARHTGHWSMPTPAKRNMRVVTGSGVVGAGDGAARSARHRASLAVRTRLARTANSRRTPARHFPSENSGQHGHRGEESRLCVSQQPHRGPGQRAADQGTPRGQQRDIRSRSRSPFSQGIKSWPSLPRPPRPRLRIPLRVPVGLRQGVPKLQQRGLRSILARKYRPEICCTSRHGWRSSRGDRGSGRRVRRRTMSVIHP
jgi:hypothetical protein